MFVLGLKKEVMFYGIFFQVMSLHLIYPTLAINFVLEWKLAMYNDSVVRYIAVCFSECGLAACQVLPSAVYLPLWLHHLHSKRDFKQDSDGSLIL
jgi:hypothetical protein